MKWPFESIGNLAKVNPRIAAADRPAPDEQVSFVPMAAISEKTCRIEEQTERCFAEVSKGYTPFRRGDVLIAKITPCFENGKMALAENLSHELGFGTTEFHVLRPSDKLIGAYLFNLLRAPFIRKAGAMKMKGAAGQRRVPADFFAALQIPLPPLAEQKRIAAILDAADALRAKRRETLAQLDTLLQSTFLDMFGDPVTNPKGWDMGVIGDLLRSVDYGTSKKASAETGVYPIIRMNNITYLGGWDFSSLKFIDLDKKELKKHLVHKGQILFNRTNSKELVGKTAVFREEKPMVFAGYLVRGITNELADPEYIGSFMNTPQTKQFLQNKCKCIVGMANINAKEFQLIPIPKPPLPLQRRFAAIVESVEQQKTRLRAHLTELDILFASLQDRAFKGAL